MSNLDDDRTPPRTNPSGPVWSLAAFSAAVFLCSVLGAKLLSKMVERDDLIETAFDRTMDGLARRAASQQPTQVYSVVRSVGVDGMTTSTIPIRGPAPVSPCGEEKGQNKPKK
ncbi:hypothetical protein [Methylocystis parvus]|uniref:Uncharacterized protein n=1 Tax=Methylocystis parvus TaxID=134 RepID=A0A6B8MCC2_9HYPH|nr:hypothetical protein [Methylocystis parvus]QGM99269.1 hypothetical protein F7D14_18465 [Methylocystis parvus]WBK00345.1 hypothetical protein MMG94_01060 [Methylocystis parvus OBBP]